MELRAAMPKIVSKLNARSPEFQENHAAMQVLVDDLRIKIAESGRGGGEKSRKKHLDRGKLLARDRVRLLLDPGSPFLELSPMAANGMYDNGAPSASVITGIGRVHGAGSGGGG